MKPKSFLYLFCFISKILPFFFILFPSTYLFSQNRNNSPTEINKTGTKQSNWSSKPFERKAFIENKGQYAADLSLTENNFSYCIDNGTKVFFYNNEVLFYFTRSLLTEEDRKEKEDPEEERKREMELEKTEKEFIRMKWLNANPNATIEVSEEQSVDYGHVISKNVPRNYTAHCKGYNKLKIKNLYVGIDVEYFFTEKDGFKYNLYISPGAEISQVQQLYEGVKNIKLLDGNIVIKTIQGNIIDHAPISYVSTNAEQKIASSFSLKNNTVSFHIENSGNEAITIDPWVSTPAMTPAPGDNGIDQYGNIYITNSNYVLEKYSSTGVLISSINVISAPYYGDMLTDSRGYCFFNTVGFHARGDASAVDSAGNFLWDSFGITECWRFVLNECNQQVLSLTGYRHSSTGFAKINTETGVLAGYTQSGTCCQDPHCGAIDYNGDVYCVVSENGGGTSIYKWTPGNTIAATYPAVGSWGYGTGNVGGGAWTQGYNGMTILGNNLYIFDGKTLFKVNKTNGAIITQVIVPGGVNKQNGGIYITSCGQLFVGSGTGVYMYDLNFNQIDFKATTGKVLDLAFNTFNQTINVCGPGHVTELSFVIPPCVFQTQPFIQPSCGGLPNGYIKLNLVGGVPDYTYTWTNNGIPLAQITDSIGNLSPGTYKCLYTDNKCPIPNRDSILIVVPSVTTNAAFTYNDVCDPVPVLFVDSSYVNSGTITAWSWQFGDGNTSILQNPSNTYANSGTYNVTLLSTTSDGCVDSISKNIKVFPKPEADFTFTNKCNGTAVPFTSISTIGTPGIITTWNWDFGDNAVATGSSTSHTYSSPGNYNVTLIVNSSNSCSDTIVHQITVFNNPVVSFTHSDVCFGDTMHFINNSTVNIPATISTYLWTFGDGGTTSNLQTPVRFYTNPGPYNVTLIATTADGCANATTSPVNAFDAPTTGFTFTNTCLLASAQFTNTTLDPTMGTTANWTWDFGDGSPLNTTVLSPLHLYATPGNYQVSLITHSTNLGCPDTLLDSITVFPMPVAKFGFRNICFNQAMNFNDSSTVSNGTITNWSWNFGDGTPLITDQHTSHMYSAFGTYSVTLIVTTNNGCKDTIAKTVVVHPLPVVQYSTTNVCDGSTVFFTGLSTIPATDTIQFYTWDFDDNSSFNTNQNPSHLYAAPGSYVVKLIVESYFGCSDSISKTSIINPNPVINYIANDSVGCEPLCVSFQNLSTILTGTNASWLWNFGDGSPTSNSDNPTNCYTNDSIYALNSFDVTLTATSDSGCVSILSKNNYITVYPDPVANFTALPQTTTITDPVVSVKDFSSGANFWYWNWGDQDTSSIFNPTPHTYQDTGVYVITLITTTQYDCIDTAYQTIIVEPDFLFYIPNAFSPNNDGINDTFYGKGIFIIQYEMKIFDRWGNMIFISDDINKHWDGKANYGNEIAQGDVYIYSIKITDINKRKHDYKGIVTLVK
ncbi:MAG: PKD domain-containing protein [Bacteroidota bacterium]|nr:PKD domain-containing protein [Bacteroidota bacterium]